MFTVFIDFPDGFNLGLYGGFKSLDTATIHCDYNKTVTQDVHFSVWRGGKCYYSTDKSVKIEG